MLIGSLSKRLSLGLLLLLPQRRSDDFDPDAADGGDQPDARP
jgi:hypothetical protein